MPSPPRLSVGVSTSALDAVQGPLETLLATFLKERVAELASLDPALEPIGREIADFVQRGGKRLRPAFVYWGHRAAGAEHDDAVLAVAAAVELLHNFALIHDDVMDRSGQRRGRPTVHEALARSRTGETLAGDAAWFGVGGAILAGDLAFVWADQLLDTAALPPAAVDRARRVFTELRVEVMAGQYLDLRLSGLPSASVEDSLRVALLKSGRYTVTRPLQLGAAAAGCSPELHALLATYGDAIGLAFQLRDDVLGLFGDPEQTGKSALGDLREGKRTPLVLRALQLAEPTTREQLARLLGDTDLDEADAERARRIVVETGALAWVEDMLVEHRATAQAALAQVSGPARDALEQLADLAVFRLT